MRASDTHARTCRVAPHEVRRRGSRGVLAWHGLMRFETKIQLGMAIMGVPLIFVIWKGDAKWPNPLRAAAARKPGEQ